MDLKEKLLSSSKLYLILDAQVGSYKHLLQVAVQSVQSGINILQVRDKYGTAKDIMNFYDVLVKNIGSHIPIIINDRVDICQSVHASGVHLGQDDLPLAYARKTLGHHKIIGMSCQTMEQARKAQDEGADYIGFGSVFKTQTKPERKPMELDLLQQVIAEIKIPVFAIGGITTTNIGILISRGVTNFAVCRALCNAADIASVTKSFKSLINHESQAVC